MRKAKKPVIARASFERLETRQLLSAAVDTTAHHFYHHFSHRLATLQARAAASTSATPTVSSTTPSASPGAVVAGLTDAVYHGDNAYTAANRPSPNPNTGLVDGTLGGSNAAVQRAVAWAASHTPNYTFVNSGDHFVYSGGTGANTATFLSNNVNPNTNPTAPTDASGAALTDPANVADTIFDAEGYFLTPSGNDGGTYTVLLGGVDDLVAVYMGGNGTPGSGTLVASAGWQGANAGLPGFQVNLPAGADPNSPSAIPIEIIFANGFGGANLNAAGGSSPATGVAIYDPNGTQITSFQTTPTNEPAPPAGPSALTAIAGNNTVLLNWNSTFLASSYSVYRYNDGADISTAVKLASGITALTYTDSTALNGHTYDYYVTADNSGGSSPPSNIVVTSPASAPTGPVTFLTGVRTNATTVQLSFTAPPLGTNYTITRSTTPNGAQTTLTPAGGQTATTFTDTNAPTTNNTDYYYTVTSVNGGGASTPVQVFVGHGEGWGAAYYSSNAADLTQNGSTKPLTGDDPNGVLGFERVDPTITVPITNAPPGWNAIQPNVNNDYAVRWTGYVEAPETGFYSLGVSNVDDREQIFVYDPNHLTNGQPTPVNISPAGHVMTTFGDTYTVPVVGTDSQPFQFTAGQKYLVQVDYNQGYGGLAANLFWSASSSAANATAGTFDTMATAAVPTYDVIAPTPAFSTIDANTASGGSANPADSAYYTFTATGGNNAIQLKWNNVEADSYNLYRATSATGPFTKITATPITASTGAPLTYLDSGLTNGTTYYYILTGVTQNGETAVNTTTGATAGLTANAAPVAAAPATPTGVVAIGTNNVAGGIKTVVNFAAVPFANTYIIQRATESSPGSGTPGAFATVPGGGAVTGTGSITFTDTDPALQAKLNYFYQVISVNGGLQSAPSTPVETRIGPALAAEGAVEVDVRASGYANGSTTSSILNVGAQGGTFNTVGSAVAVGAVADANNVSYQSFNFNGNSASSSFNAPADLTGNSSRSIELWVNNPTIDGVEETMVSWSKRGGNPDGSNMSFSYGSQYGVGLWGGEYDLQYTTDTAPGVANPGTAPVANSWHYLVFTYDGTNNDVYVDGHLYLQRAVTAPGLATFAGLPINLAAQNGTGGTTGFNPASLGSLDLASVRVEGGALTQTDVAYNYTAGVPGQSTVDTLPTYVAPAGGASYVFNHTTGALVVRGGSVNLTADQATSGDPNPTLNLIAGNAGTAVTMATNQHLASLTLLDGATAAMTASPTTTLTLGTGLTIQGASSLDLGHAKMSVPAAVPLTTVQTYIKNGYNGGAWTGTGGITTSAGAAANNIGVGYVAQPDGSTLVRATVYGDTQLVGTVGLSDYNILASNFNKAGTWSQGDFDNSGLVDLADYNKLAQNFNKSVPWAL